MEDLIAGTYLVAEEPAAGWAQTWPLPALGTGELTFSSVLKDGENGIDGLSWPTAVAVSPDGGHIYVASSIDASLSVFRRTLHDDTLEFVEIVKDGVGGLDGLNGINSVAVSPDGHHVYTVADTDDSLMVFRRNPGSGVLTFVERHVDDPDGVNGLVRAMDVTLSPDGDFVYVADRTDGAVGIFSRDATSGRLVFVGSLQEGQNGAQGLARVTSLTVSPNGQQVYAVDDVTGTVATFSRDAGSGGLTFVQLLQDGIGGVDGLDTVLDLAVSSDGRHVYAVSASDNSLASFGRAAGTRVHLVELESLEVVASVDFGNHQLAAEIHGSTWSDQAADAVRDVDDPGTADRAIGEFDVSANAGQTVIEATIEFLVDLAVPGATDTGRFNVFWYSGNGAAELTDFSIPATVFHGISTTGTSLPRTHSLDVTPCLHTLLGSGGDYFGALFDMPFDQTDGMQVVEMSLIVTTAEQASPAHSVTLAAEEVAVHVDFGHYDVASPVVTLSAPVATQDAMPSVTVSATDNDVLSDGTTVLLDVDLNNDGDFLDALEVGYTTSSLVGGAATFDIGPSLAEGDYSLQARLNDPTGNEGTSAVEPLSVDVTAPSVQSIVRADANPTTAASVDFTVTFGEDVIGVDLGDFTLSTTGVTGAGITSLSGSGASYTVAVDTGSGDGRIRLDLLDNDSIADTAGNLLGGTGSGNGDFAGEAYQIDRTAPSVSSIVRAHADPINAVTVEFTVTFDEDVVGVDASDFVLTTTGVNGASLSNATGSGATYTVIVAAGYGNGTIRLDLVDDDSITDAAANPLGGAGAGNGDFSGGETYTITTSVAISGTIWSDQRRDGVWDGGEAGAEGVTIFLDLNENGQLDTGEPSTTSNADNPGTTGIDETGQYTFTGIESGTYAVTQIVPDRNEQTFPADAVGGSGELDFVAAVRDDDGGIGGLDGVVSAAVSPDGKHVYLASDADNALAVFDRDSTTGALTFVEVQKDSQGGVNGLALAFGVSVSPDGGHVYATGSLDNAVAVFSRDPGSGALSFVQTVKDGEGGMDGLRGAADLCLSPDQRHVYVAGRTEYALAVLERDPLSGELSFLQVIRDSDAGVDGLYGVTEVALSPDGMHLYAAAPNDNAVSIFARDEVTGALSFVAVLPDGEGGVDGLYGVRTVCVSQDGSHVYVAGSWSGSVSAFSRDMSSGQLSFVETFEDAGDGGDYLYGASDVIVSADGRHVYVAAEYDNALSVFEREPSNGSLMFLQALVDNTDGVDGLRAVQNLALSPDGKHVYAPARYDDSVAVFERDPVTGELAYLERYINGVAGVLGIGGAYDVAVSPRGDHVYVAGHESNAVAVFTRDSQTGGLSFVATLTDRQGGVEGLLGCWSVAVSPDGKQVYTGAELDDAVTVFDRDLGTLASASHVMELAPGQVALGADFGNFDIEPWVE